MKATTKAFYRMLAERHGMSIDDFCAAVGVTHDGVMCIVSGTRIAQMRTREKLLRVLTTEELDMVLSGFFYD